MKKLLLLALALCLFGAPARAITLTGMETNAARWEDNAFFPRMYALTGVDMQAHGIDDGRDYRALLDDLMHGKASVDVLFKAGLSREEEIRLLNSGAVIDLAPYIETCMPNLAGLLDAHPEWRRIIALEDGRIASLPQIDEAGTQVCVYINRAWLDALGLAMPENIAELTDVLLAMRGGDPNGNGEADECAADLLGVFEMRWLLPYFGIVADDYNLARDADGSIVFAPEMSEYRDFVACLNGWYAQGILPSAAFTETHAQRRMENGMGETTVRSGLLVDTTPTAYGAQHALDFEPLLMPGPDGMTRWRDFAGEVWTGCFAVTSQCADPAAALRWADALYAEDGARLAYAGVEGVDYAADENGWRFLTSAARSLADLRAESTIHTGLPAPGLVPNAFLAEIDSEIDRHWIACNARVLAVAERVTPAYCLAADDQRRADELAATLGELVDCGIARFVTGEVPLDDEHWNAWLAELAQMGSGELVAIFRTAE